MGEWDADGYLTKVIIFKVAARQAHVTLPAGWIAAGSSSELYLTNPKIQDARITVRISTLESPAKFDEPWIETIKPLILGSLPKDGKNQRIDNVTPNVVTNNGWTSVEFKASVDRFGRRFSTGWLFIRFQNGRLIETVYTSTDDKFPTVRAAAIQMLNGWGDHLVPKPASGR